MYPGTVKFHKVCDYGHPRNGKNSSALGAYSVPQNLNCRYGLEFVQLWGNPLYIGALVGIHAKPLDGSFFTMSMACRDLENWFRETLNVLSDRWMQQMLWRGRFDCDNQVFMASVPFSEICTGLSACGMAF